MRPPEINDFIAKDVIGQEESLRFVSVAICTKDGETSRLKARKRVRGACR